MSHNRITHLPRSVLALFVDNNVQAPLAPSVLAAAVDLTLSLSTGETGDKSQSSAGRTLESKSTGSSTSSQKGKSNDLGLNTPEAQKKLGKFFKGLGPSKAPSSPTDIEANSVSLDQRSKIYNTSPRT